MQSCAYIKAKPPQDNHVYISCVLHVNKPIHIRVINMHSKLPFVLFAYQASNITWSQKRQRIGKQQFEEVRNKRKK